jgi:hypothetical protein
MTWIYSLRLLVLPQVEQFQKYDAKIACETHGLRNSFHDHRLKWAFFVLIEAKNTNMFLKIIFVSIFAEENN